MDKQLEMLQEKLSAWTGLLKTGHLSRNLAWKAFRGTIWKTVDYVLPATMFTEEQCNTLIKPVYCEVLPNVGANRNFPNAFRCAPNKYYGLALPHPYDEQGIWGIHYLLMHGIAFTETGRLFRTSIEEMQLEIGVRHPFVSYPFNVYGQLATEGLCYTLWKFISENKILMEKDDFQLIPEQRENDAYLMEIFTQYTTDRKCLRSLNRCRLHLQAYTLADVTTGDRLQISKAAFHLTGEHPNKFALANTTADYRRQSTLVNGNLRHLRRASATLYTPR
eukprot:scaffold20541_cov58-Attheya_sp.AAC.4